MINNYDSSNSRDCYVRVSGHSQRIVLFAQNNIIYGRTCMRDPVSNK